MQLLGECRRLGRRISARVHRRSTLAEQARGERRLREAERRTRARLEDAKVKIRAARREYEALAALLDGIPRFEFGSYTPGVDPWSRRWQERPGHRVLLYAFKDYSGSFFKWAEAINDFTDYAARLVVARPHQYGYPGDLLLSTHSEAGYAGLYELLEQADVVHVKDEVGFFDGTNDLPGDLLGQLDTPTVFTHYGGYARKYADDPAYAAFVKGFSARIAVTPDLCFEWFDGSYIPQSIDTRRFAYSWQDGRVLGHSPSLQARKGTATLLEAVQGLDLTLDLVEGVPHAECLRRKAAHNLFFDQAGRERVEKLGTDRVIGWYGNSALESAVLGIPTIAHLSEEAFAGAVRAGRDIRERCAILNTPLDVAGMRATIEGYFELSSREKRELSIRTREWIEDFHSHQVVGPQLAAVYDELLPAVRRETDSPAVATRD